MKPESPPIVRPRRRLPRVPAFYPVPLKANPDGWTTERQAHFLGHLGETGSVSAACARVGMSRNSAYKLRKKPGADSFAAAWDAALGQPVRKVTIDDLQFLAYHGLVRPRFRGGKYVGSRQKPDNSALLRLLSFYDRAMERADRIGDTYCSEIGDMRVTRGYTERRRETRQAPPGRPELRGPFDPPP